MLATAQSASKLLDELKVLRGAAKEGEQLRSEMQTLSSRATEDAAASKRLQQELAQAINDLTVSQDQQQVYRTELQRVQKQVPPCCAPHVLSCCVSSPLPRSLSLTSILALCSICTKASIPCCGFYACFYHPHLLPGN